MKIRNFVICLAIGLSLVACSKKVHKYTINIYLNDAKTTKVYRKDKDYTDNKWKSIKDSLISKEDSNYNTARLLGVDISYNDEKGKLVQKTLWNDGRYSSNYGKLKEKINDIDDIKYEVNYSIPLGKTLTVVAKAEGGEPIDTLVAGQKVDEFIYNRFSVNKNVSRGKPTLKVELIKDGIVVGTNEAIGEDGKVEVSLTR